MSRARAHAEPKMAAFGKAKFDRDFAEKRPTAARRGALHSGRRFFRLQRAFTEGKESFTPAQRPARTNPDLGAHRPRGVLTAPRRGLALTPCGARSNPDIGGRGREVVVNAPKGRHARTGVRLAPAQTHARICPRPTRTNPKQRCHGPEGADGGGFEPPLRQSKRDGPQTRMNTGLYEQENV